MPQHSDLRATSPYAIWRAGVVRQLGEDGYERRLRTRTEDGVTIEPLYAPGCGGVDANPSLVPSRSGAWLMRSHLDLDAGAAVLAEAVRDDLANDVRSFYFTAASATALPKLASALEGLALDQVELAFGGALAGDPAAAFLKTLWERHRTAADARRASLGAEHAVTRPPHGVWPARLSAARWFDAGLPLAGSLGVALAAGAEYLRDAERRGISAAHATVQLEFEVGVGSRLFENVAAIRGARLLWLRLLQLAGGAEVTSGPRLVVVESQRILSATVPDYDLLRGAVAAWSGAVAGADVIVIEPFDSLSSQGALGRRLARNTHHVVREEGQLHRVADPAAGSWAFETLTDQLAAKAWQVAQEIEAEGGYAASRKRGDLERRVDIAIEQRMRSAARAEGVSA